MRLLRVLVGPIAALILIFGNAGVILGLLPAHVSWTVYTLFKTERFDALLKVALLFALPALFGIWVGLSIAVSVHVGVGYGFFTPWVSAFEAFRHDHDNESKKFLHCIVDGTWRTIKGSCTVVQDFADMCYHSFPVYLRELRESPSSNDSKPLSMHETIERYRQHTKDVQSNNNTPVVHNMQHLKHETASLAKKIELLEVSKRKLLGEGLGSCTIEELQQIEHQLEKSVCTVRARKTHVFKEQIVQLKEREKTLAADNAPLCAKGQDLYKSKQVRDKQIVRILGKAPTIASAAYLRMAGRPPVLPSSNLSYSENFLYMLDSLGNRSYTPNPRLARVLDILFILHAEHEMNCSTAAARHLASSGVN